MSAESLSSNCSASECLMSTSQAGAQVRLSGGDNAVKQQGYIMDETQPRKALSGDVSEDLSYIKVGPIARSSLKHMHELYESVTAEITVEPTSKDEPDVKAFFKVLRNHRLQSKVVYVLTVVTIVFISHAVLTTRWLLPYYYTVTTPTLFLARLIMYWKMKYQYFMLDFCYFANIYWLIYLWVMAEREEMLAVGFAVANGPLIWALLVFRNSLVFHSLDKVTSLYIHLLPSLMSYIIRWYPDETSEGWYKPFPHAQLEFNFVWLVAVPFAFLMAHQLLYIVVVNLILRPSEDYLNMYRYITSKESSLIFRMCNILGPKFRMPLYVIWCLTIALMMLLLNPIWYNFYIAHCAIIVIFIIVAIFNGATYYIDVFSLEGIDKNKSSKSKKNQEGLPANKEGLVAEPRTSMNGHQLVVISAQNGEVITKTM